MFFLLPLDSYNHEDLNVIQALFWVCYKCLKGSEIKALGTILRMYLYVPNRSNAETT